MSVKEILARVRFLPSGQGGLRGEFVSRRRIPIDFGQDPSIGGTQYYDSVVELIGLERAAPGEECVVRIRPSNPEALEGRVAIGTEFGLWEGRIFARGIVTDLG